MDVYEAVSVDLESVANAIRRKTGESSTLRFPKEYVSAIDSIHTGGTGGDLENAEIQISDIIASAQAGDTYHMIYPHDGYDGLGSVKITGFSRYSFMPYSIFSTSGLSSNEWISDDGTKYVTKVSGSWNVSGGKLICDGSYFSFDVPQSNILVQCKCSISSNFTPKNASNWYQQSCIFGMELSGAQRDYGVTLPSNAQRTPAIGYASGSPASGSISIGSDEDHVISLLHTGTTYYLYIDGVLSAQQAYTAGGTHLSKMGLFWNNASSATVVTGTVSKLGVWEFTEFIQSLPISLPDF